MNSAKKLQPESGASKVEKHPVHEFVARLKKEFEREALIQRDFRNAVLAGSLEFIKQVSEKDDISTKEKIGILAEIYKAAANAFKTLTSEETPAPKMLWDDRPNWKYSPCQFVVENYATYKKGLSLNGVRQADRKLAKALENYKTKHGWPADFDLPTRLDALDQINDPVEPISLAGLEYLPPHERKELLRRWRAHDRLQKVAGLNKK
ncbi:hypothetical protein [Phreatobacter stygius]|uniref:Uncharacterized protein n=1 Tax=Phreatobacter stygius TaxID=1940610 RepID=A0A4D7B1N5_9HYPH|nr:hypothetical protein [Phreatobacter stygius]QCI63950.1 hypothetical protein E8M01_06635 [Phreatobacter stygius]